VGFQGLGAERCRATSERSLRGFPCSAWLQRRFLMLLSLRLPLLLAASLAAFPALAQVGGAAGGAGAAAPGAVTTTPGTGTTSPFATTPTPSITGTPPSQYGSFVGSTPTIGGSASTGSSVVGQTPAISPSATPSTTPFATTTVPQST